MPASGPGLNPAQLRAVRHHEGPLLVLAGPGSGKTRVVTHRIAALIARGVEARNILAVTFTNKAAGEMRERVRSLVGARARGLLIATFHSTCARILREEIEALGYGRNFTIYDEASQHSLMRSVLRDFRGAGVSASPSAVLAEAARMVPREAGEGPEPVPAEAAPAADPDAARAAFLGEALGRYRAELRARNAVDFEDLIHLTVRLLRERPRVLDRWRDRFRHILVDEYQDTNREQDAILSLLAGKHRNLCVVGDDDQSIYGWRGAEVEHILGFERRFPGAAVVRLEQNYRSTRRIVQVASAVIGKNTHRHPKGLFTRRGLGEPVRVLDLRDQDQEAEHVAGEIAAELKAAAPASPGGVASRFAVLARTNEQMRPLEQALRREGIPYRLLGGRSFFDRKEVLDVLAYLRVAANPADEEALYRAINVPPRGIGARSIELLREAARARGVGPWEALAALARGDRIEELGERAAGALRAFVEVVERVKAQAARGSPRLVLELLEACDYRSEVDRSYKDPQVREARMNLAREVQSAWEAYRRDSEGGLPGFLDSLSLKARDDDEDGQGYGVTLATVHGAKGLEFPSVYVVGLEEGLFPHARSVEDGRALAEERRLFFVAVTRAMDRLTLTRAAERELRGKVARTVPSRFLEDVPAEAAERRDYAAPAGAEAVSGHVARLRLILGGKAEAGGDGGAAGSKGTPPRPRLARPPEGTG